MGCRCWPQGAQTAVVAKNHPVSVELAARSRSGVMMSSALLITKSITVGFLISRRIALLWTPRRNVTNDSSHNLLGINHRDVCFQCPFIFKWRRRRSAQRQRPGSCGRKKPFRKFKGGDHHHLISVILSWLSPLPPNSEPPSFSVQRLFNGYFQLAELKNTLLTWWIYQVFLNRWSSDTGKSHRTWAMELIANSTDIFFFNPGIIETFIMI